MKIVFLGTGEAFDENIPNNSHLVITEKIKLLLDCGCTASPQLWRYNPDPNFLDAVYISHQHADHCFGLPMILQRMWEDGRENDMTIICQKELKDFFEEFMDMAGATFHKKFKYKVNFIEAAGGRSINLEDLKLSFQESTHSGKNLAIKIENEGRKIIYSGDGAPKDNEFYKNADLLIQEAYLYDEEKMGHMSILGAIKFAEENNVKCLALTHMNRDVRRNILPVVKDKIKSDRVKIIIPEPLEEYNFVPEVGVEPTIP